MPAIVKGTSARRLARSMASERKPISHTMKRAPSSMQACSSVSKSPTPRCAVQRIARPVVERGRRAHQGAHAAHGEEQHGRLVDGERGAGHRQRIVGASYSPDAHDDRKAAFGAHACPSHRSGNPAAWRSPSPRTSRPARRRSAAGRRASGRCPGSPSPLRSPAARPGCRPARPARRPARSSARHPPTAPRERCSAGRDGRRPARPCRSRSGRRNAGSPRKPAVFFRR